MLACGSSRQTEEEEEGDEEGSPRWRVKNLVDIDTPYIRFDRIVKSSVREQSKLRAREVSSSTPRLASETQVYEVIALLTAIKREIDGDYHLVLREPDGHVEMIAELPNPEGQAIVASGRAPLYRRAKKTIDSLVGVPPLMIEAEVDPPKKIRLTGIGFFDVKHLIAQRGMATNLRELHPILTVKSID